MWFMVHAVYQNVGIEEGNHINIYFLNFRPLFFIGCHGNGNKHQKKSHFLGEKYYYLLVFFIYLKYIIR